MDSGTDEVDSGQKSGQVPLVKQLEEDADNECSETKLEHKPSKEISTNKFTLDSSTQTVLGEITHSLDTATELYPGVVVTPEVNSDKQNTPSTTEAEEDSLQLHTLSIGDPQATSISQFIEAVNSTLQKIEEFLLDHRSIQMKRSFSSGIFQDLSAVCFTFESAAEQEDKVKCAISLMQPDNILSLLYSFLAEVFRGQLPLPILGSLLGMHVHVDSKGMCFISNLVCIEHALEKLSSKVSLP